ncbi:glycosyltransferase family 4 protein [Carboxylicivirga sediminis]|uniref:Glycosyltransferase family 4 protein n=1 Tax=Carboxylicivirga sediminis TaxID=2006564 RepID=A0A941FB37_9BACT|nr:glycosyltransferase family 1 protein [Carboxylicivirga sediminis]MBR8538358.1 glycosyltransferase family 4 protein [Carboxylicivirga sediminis]
MSQNKFHITYFFRKPQPQYFSIEKVFEQVLKHLPPSIIPRVYKLKTGTNGWWGRIKALIEARQNKGAINHITGDITFIAMALPRKGLVVTYHDLESLTQYSGWRFQLLKFLWVTMPVRRAQVVTAISQHTKEQLIKWTNCSPYKIMVIPNPLPEELSYHPKACEKEHPSILVMGTKDNKNVEGIFEAVRLLEAEVQGVKLEVKGKGLRVNEKTDELIEESEKSENMAEKSSEGRARSPKSEDRSPNTGEEIKGVGLKAEKMVKGTGLKVKGETFEDRNAKSGEVHRVPFIGHYQLIIVGEMTPQQEALADQYQLDIDNLVQVPYEQIQAAYQRCDMLCFPSFYEGFGLPIIEAQAIGRPVITSNFGAMKEVAGQAALKVNPQKREDIARAIQQLTDDEALRTILVEKGLKNVERFKGQTIANGYSKVYRALVRKV